MKLNRREAAAILFFVALIAVFVLSVNGLNRAEKNSETELVYTAVKNAALTCYATEGFYPSELIYLTEHYGLRYNEDLYLVSYDAFASNVLPEIRVIERGQSTP